MRLRERQIRDLAAMVVGDDEAFPYRGSMFITRFFQRCGFDYVHDGSTRRRWAEDRLTELNLGPSAAPDLPSTDLLQIISELLDIDDFERANKQRQPALDRLNQVVGRQGLVAYIDAGTCHVRNNGTVVSSSTVRLPSRPLSPEEIAQRQRVAAFLDSASEHDLTERLIVPLFQRLGFQRVTPAGHREKTLEFGKDLWM